MNRFIFFLITICSFFLFKNSEAQVPFLNHRKTITLKDWSFVKGNLNKAHKFNYDDREWQNIQVPHTYSMDAIEDIGYYQGIAWYRTNILIPKSMLNERIFIRFEGVGQNTRVIVNEKNIGKHAGGYSAFCFEITNHIKFGEENLIAVKVDNYPDYKTIPINDKLFNAYGGIYRPVQIFSTPKCNISPLYHASSGIFIEQLDLNEKEAVLEVRTHVSHTGDSKNAKLLFRIKNGLNKKILQQEKQFTLEQESQIIKHKIKLEDPIRWNGRIDPHLYSLEVILVSENSWDTIVQNFGIRTYAVSPDKGFILNEKPYRLYGVCRHQEWKQNGPALLEKHLLADMDLIDEIGAKAIRLAHYQQSDVMYEEADKRGLLVWAEIPFVNDYSGRESSNAKQQLTELILQNYNHPSIFVWGLWNEVRANESAEEPCVSLTKELNDLAHQLDKTRLTTSASDKGMESNMGNITDLQAWNKYFGWYYGKYEDMGTWLDDSHNKYPNIELCISEYGVGGNINQQDSSKLEKPAGDYFPEMAQTKYHEITWKIIKDRPFLWSSFIWNMFDFSVSRWNRGGIPSLNHKGLVTYDRKVKKDAFYFYKANWSDEPVLYIAERRNNNRTQKVTTIKVFTNQKSISLYVNDKKIDEKKMQSDVNTIHFNKVELEEGENNIKVISNNNGIKLEDSVIWTCQTN